MPYMPEIIIEEVEPNHVHMDDSVVIYDALPSEDTVLEVHDEEYPEEEWQVQTDEPGEFELPKYPGAPDDAQDVLEVSDESEVEIEEELPKNIWEVEKYPNLADWLRERCSGDNIPAHNAGRDPDDLYKVKRTISYLEKVLKHAAEIVEGDFDRKVDVQTVGPMMTKIEESINNLHGLKTKLESEKKGKRKKAQQTNELVKEAQKAPHVGGIIVTVPLLISRIARVCINGAVSSGHDLEDLFNKQATLYKLSDREKAEVVQLLLDMNYPLRMDRIHLIDDDSAAPGDWNQNFPG